MPPAAGSRPPTTTLSRTAGRLLSSSIRIGGPLAKRLLPPPAVAGLRRIVQLADRLSTPAMLSAFEKRTRRLSEMQALSPPDRFGGPIVLANNALAWGGVERQIVYTLMGLQARKAGDLGLLCVRLGIDAEHDFYRKDLATFSGFVRNVLPLGDAMQVMKDYADPVQTEAITACIAWMPIGVQREIWQFLADFSKLKPSVVHVWQDGLSITAGYAARLAGVPRIVVAGRNVAPDNFGYYRPYMAPAYRELADCADVTMISNSRAGAQSYAAWLDLPHDRIGVIRNGIDTTVIKPPEALQVDSLRRTIGIPEDVPVVGSVFRFYPEKQPILWVETAAVVARAMPDVHFVVVGAGPLRRKMRTRARRLGFADRLHLPGTVANPSAALKMFDVFLLTSKFEGTPNVVLEAGVMGVAVVATDAGGTGETVDQGRTGFVVGGGRASDLAERVIEVLANPAFSEQVARSAPQFVAQRFGLERMIDDTLATYAEATSRPKPA